MNRQAITFLTLFSLILVLSIYYILLPPEGEASEVSVNNEELSQIEVLQQNLEKERADLISEIMQLLHQVIAIVIKSLLLWLILVKLKKLLL